MFPLPPTRLSFFLLTFHSRLPARRRNRGSREYLDRGEPIFFLPGRAVRLGVLIVNGTSKDARVRVNERASERTRPCGKLPIYFRESEKRRREKKPRSRSLSVPSRRLYGNASIVAIVVR